MRTSTFGCPTEKNETSLGRNKRYGKGSSRTNQDLARHVLVGGAGAEVDEQEQEEGGREEKRKDSLPPRERPDLSVQDFVSLAGFPVSGILGGDSRPPQSRHQGGDTQLLRTMTVDCARTMERRGLGIPRKQTAGRCSFRRRRPAAGIGKGVGIGQGKKIQSTPGTPTKARPTLPPDGR